MSTIITHNVVQIDTHILQLLCEIIIGTILLEPQEYTARSTRLPYK